MQGTAEGAPFTRAQMDALVALASAGIGDIVNAQRGWDGVRGEASALRDIQ